MKCNHDCLNCAFEDCVNDEFTSKEYIEINSRNKSTRQKRDTNISYYEAHKEEILARQRIYRMENREAVNERKRRYREAHIEQARKSSREYMRKLRAKSKEEAVV